MRRRRGPSLFGTCGLAFRGRCELEPQGPGLGDLKEGTGEPARLRLDWASRKAATDIRWEESDAKLSMRGRGTGGGSVSSGEGGLR